MYFYYNIIDFYPSFIKSTNRKILKDSINLITKLIMFTFVLSLKNIYLHVVSNFIDSERTITKFCYNLTKVKFIEYVTALRCHILSNYSTLF